jgi:hypothetical protein
MMAHILVGQLGGEMDFAYHHASLKRMDNADVLTPKT